MNFKRKNTLYLLFLVTSVFSYGQTTLNINIISDVKIDSLIINRIWSSDKYPITFKNQQIYLYSTTVHINDSIGDKYTFNINNKKIYAWLDPNKIEVTLLYKNGNLKISNIINSLLYYKDKKYQATLKSLQKKNKPTKSFILKSITENDQNIHITEPLSDFLYYHQNDKENLKIILTLLDTQAKEIKSHKLFKKIYNRIKTLINLKKIDLSKYEVIDLDNHVSTLSQHTDAEYSILDIWYLNCITCITDHDKIKKKRSWRNHDKVKIISLLNVITDKWTTYSRKKKMSWTNLRLVNGHLAMDLNLYFFPTYIVINSKGEILGNYNDIEKAMNSIPK